MHQLSSAVGRVELKLYPKQMAEIDESMNYFWDLLEGVPGIRSHRTAKGSKTTMGGWYNLLGIYNTEELGGFQSADFVKQCEMKVLNAVPDATNLYIYIQYLIT